MSLSENGGARPRDLLLRAARAVTPAGVVEDAWVLTRGDRIARVGRGGAPEGDREGAEVLDLGDATLAPGYIDIHIHGALGVDVSEADAEGLRRVARFLATRGVTAWLPTLVPAPGEAYKRAAREVALLMDEQDGPGAEPAARALGLHYEGPFVSEQQCGALRTQFFRRYAGPADLDALARVPRPDAVHMTTLAPEVEGGEALVRELVARGWVASVGHTRAEVADLERARAAGARHMTHFMNAMRPLHHRAPGPVGWGLLADDVTCDLIADGVHSDPLLIDLVVRCKTPGRVALISDAVAPTGLGDGEFRVWGETITVEAGRTRNGRGSIAGSVITMHDAARLAASRGLSASDVALMASHVPARVLGLERECGAMEEGTRADLVALDDGGRVLLTLVGGRIAHADLPAIKT